MRFFLCLLFLGNAFLGFSQEVFHIKIEDAHSKNPIDGAVVHFLGKHYLSDKTGNVSIKNVKKGMHTLKISHLGYEEYQRKIEIPISAKKWVVALKENVNQLSQVVLSSRKEKNIQVATVIRKEELLKNQSENLAKIVASVSGVSMLQTGGTIAKPVIHGLHSNRVLILNNEVRQEGQQWGADHAPEIDPSVANAIQVIKGAESVRYGADALGGVILLSPNKLPFGDGLHGDVSSSFDTNGKKVGTSVRLESSVPGIDNWAWRFQGSSKVSGDLKTADYHLTNTGTKEMNFSLASGFEQNNWGIEAFYSLYNNEIGIFYGSHIGNLDDLLFRFEVGRPLADFPFSYQFSAPKQKVLHHLFKLKGFYENLAGGKLSFQYAYQKDIRREFNLRRMDRTAIPALDMNLATHSLDISWEKKLQNWETIFGTTLSNQENFNKPGTGVVPVIPNFASFSYGAFAIGKYVKNNWEAEVGVRYDAKKLNADGYDIFGNRYGNDHNFHNLTYSLGAKYTFNDATSLTSNIGVAWRAPQVNELYSNGLHHGAGTFDIGDEKLASETGVKWLNTFKYQKEKWEIILDAYAQIIRNYIYDTPTGDTRTLFSGVYPIFQYKQADAFFRGGDLQLNYQFLPWLKYGLQASVVYANELKTNNFFPFIPSERISNELQWNIFERGKIKKWYFSVKHHFVAKQNRFDPAQELVATTPNAYHLFETEMGMRLAIKGRQSLFVHLSVENLFNKLYKEYTNRFRYYAHDMGRNVQIRVNYSF